MVGVDGTATSAAALEFAVDAAVARGVPLVAVRAWSDWFVEAAQLAPADRAAVDEEERTRVLAQLAPWQAKHPDLPVEAVVEADAPSTHPACARPSAPSWWSSALGGTPS